MANGLLGDFIQYLRDAAPGGALNPELQPVANYAQSVAQGVPMQQGVNRYEDAMRAAYMQAAGMPTTPQQQQAAGGLLADLIPGGGIGGQMIGGLLGHTVYHGSPHKWLQPDISKVGTGEGAQAYGHGFYSAEAPDVAKSYQQFMDPSGSGLNFLIDGKPVRTTSLDESAIYDSLAAGKRRAEKYANYLDAEASSWRNRAIERGADSRQQMRFDKAAELERQASELRSMINRGVSVEHTGGYLYKLDIPDEDIARYLDWDKPLSEQPEHVRNILTAWQKEHGASIQDGESALREIAFDLRMKGLDDSQDAVAKKLEEMGIPGIRYLDAGSRGTGKGTYNYVTFDPSRIKVLERNGEKMGLLGK